MQANMDTVATSLGCQDVSLVPQFTLASSVKSVCFVSMWHVRSLAHYKRSENNKQEILSVFAKRRSQTWVYLIQYESVQVIRQTPASLPSPTFPGRMWCLWHVLTLDAHSFLPFTKYVKLFVLRPRCNVMHHLLQLNFFTFVQYIDIVHGDHGS